MFAWNFLIIILAKKINEICFIILIFIDRYNDQMKELKFLMVFGIAIVERVLPLSIREDNFLLFLLLILLTPFSHYR